MNAIENWSDVEEMMRRLLPPESIVSLLRTDTLRYAITEGGRDWLERVQAARVSLDVTEARTTAQNSPRGAIATEG